jgi:CDP-4-dehydro-6-deoxyglucose reductase
VRVSLTKSNRTFSVAPGQSVLDAALDAHLNLPHSCKGGNCGACRARLLEGRVTYPNGPPLGLSAGEVADNLILLCQARPAGDLRIETFEMQAADEAVVKRLPARIERSELLSHDVMAVFLKLPAAETFSFVPGQYVDILLPGGRRRSFSIASPPHDARLLELHVRRVPGGEFTEPLFGADPRRALLTIEGPLGGFVYRERDVPMLLIGGGTGLAPLQSILRHVIENGLGRAMTLYWGVRSARDLYAHDALTALALRTPSLRYEAVLSEPHAGWTGQRGFVHDAVLKDFDGFEIADVYASGPPAMIAAVRREFGPRGVDPSRLFFDSFDYAPE